MVNISALVESSLYSEGVKATTVADKILKAISKTSHDVKRADIMRLLVFSPNPTSADKATNELIKDRIGVDLIGGDEDIEKHLKKAGLTQAEIDATLEGDLD